MDTLTDIVKSQVSWYAAGGKGLDLRLFRIFDDVNRTYAITVVDDPPEKHTAELVILARVEGDKVIIEEDRTDKPLVDALMQAGIPREQIILAYAGEKLPETEK